MQGEATLIGRGDATRTLSEDEVRSVLQQAFKEYDLKGKRVLFIIPDGTRTAPIPMLFRNIYELLHQDVKTLDFLIALGTHMPMSQEAINKLIGVSPAERHGKYLKARVFNHEWSVKENFRTIGHIGAEEIKQISSGLLEQGVDVTLNKMIFDYDQLIVCGPVFPHEVAGYSGGNKYFFPGISGPEVINLTHWLGALITNFETIGTKYTPVRAVINRAANFIKVSKLCLSFVVKGHDIAGLYFGSPEDAWSAATDLSAQLHVIYTDKQYQTVLSVMPALYDDIWTAGKGMYKMERACTRWNPSSPTAARSSSTRLTSTRSVTLMARSSTKSAITRETTSPSSGTSTSSTPGASSPIRLMSKAWARSRTASKSRA
jgi:lactate racemase